jgi:hypothetical protein
LVLGQRSNGDFGIYSLIEERYVFELTRKLYTFGKTNVGEVKFSVSVSGEMAFVLAGDTVVVVDLSRFTILHIYNYLESSQVRAFCAEFNIDKSKAYSVHISASGQGAVLSRLLSNRGYVLYLDFSLADPVAWLWSSAHSTYAECSNGQLIYGILERRPVAWDKATGALAWKADVGTITNNIQISDGWVVYSQTAGYVQCFERVDLG